MGFTLQPAVFDGDKATLRDFLLWFYWTVSSYAAYLQSQRRRYSKRWRMGQSSNPQSL